MDAYIRNVVFAGPDGAWRDDHWEGGQRALASFYAELLGLRIIREDWVVVAKDESTFPRLAFGDGPTPDYRPPRWPDPNHPQQVHLDFPARDLDAAEALALELGATKLQDRGDFRSYADPVGHPFCVYRDVAAVSDDGPLPGRIGRIMFDCSSPRDLASFYAELLDLPKRSEDSRHRVEIAHPDDPLPALAFQHAVFEAPRWPDPAYPQQLHLDLHFDDITAAYETAERLGAIRLGDMGGSCAVYADPAAHPFCLCAPGQ